VSSMMRRLKRTPTIPAQASGENLFNGTLCLGGQSSVVCDAAPIDDTSTMHAQANDKNHRSTLRGIYK